MYICIYFQYKLYYAFPSREDIIDVHRGFTADMMNTI